MADVKGFIAPVRSFKRRTRNGAHVEDVKVDPGGGANVTVEHMGPPGDDSPPLPTDSVGAFPVEGTGRAVAGGYADPLNIGLAVPGEVRRYARDADGNIVGTYYARADGSIELANVNGSVKLNADGGTLITNSNGSIELEADGRARLVNADGSVDLSAIGAVALSNASGSIVLSDSGEVTINGVVFDTSGNITTSAEVTAGTVGLKAHLHIGSPTAVTGPVSNTGAPIP